MGIDLFAIMGRLRSLEEKKEDIVQEVKAVAVQAEAIDDAIEEEMQLKSEMEAERRVFA